MRLSEASVEEVAARRVVHEALARGVRLIDTADVYAPKADAIGHNETIVAQALAESAVGASVTVATKGGLRRKGKTWLPDGRAKHLKEACRESRRRLGVERIDLYQLHAPDPKVPIATSVRALMALRREGQVREIGLCNIRLEELQIACDIAPVAAVQVELSPMSLRSLKNGLVSFCARNDILLLAHSPLGGHRRKTRLSKHPCFVDVAKRHGVAPFEVALAWLLAIDECVVALPGASRLESVRSSAHAAELRLSDEDLETIDREIPAGRVVRAPRQAVPEDADGEVVVFVGYPGAGKSTLAEALVGEGYKRVNRDKEGGTLRSLLPLVERHLAAGEKRLVLDNTYPRRDARFDIVDLISSYGLPTRCVWLQTTLEQSQVNACRRMIERFGRLLDAGAMKLEGDANTFTPDAQYRYRRELEPPREDEGFTAIDRVPFVETSTSHGDGRALFLDAFEPTTARRAVLDRYREDGYRLIQLVYAPGGVSEQGLVSDEGLEVYICPHPPGPSGCWCRKPLPGLGLWLIAKYDLDPASCLIVADTAVDRTFAERLGIPTTTSEELFG